MTYDYMVWKFDDDAPNEDIQGVLTDLGLKS